MSDIDINDIRRLDGGLLLVFRGLLRRHSTTAVARELHLSQSAVSHALSRLRDLFHDPLFIRRPRGLEPTRRALELAPQIDALIDLAGASLRRQAAFDPACSTRMFNLCAPEFVTALIGADLIRVFRKAAPNASFSVQYRLREAALNAVKRGTIDIALGRFAAVPAGLTAHVLYEDRYCVVARRNHPVLKGRISAAQYSRIGHVFANSSSEVTEEEAASGGIAFVALVPQWLTALSLVAASDAIATVPRRLAERQAALLNLQVISPSFVNNPITVSAVYRSGGMDAGVDWLLGQIGKLVSVR